MTTITMTPHDGAALRKAAQITGCEAYARLADMAPKAKLGKMSHKVEVEVSGDLCREVCAAPVPGVGALLDCDPLVNVGTEKDANAINEALGRARDNRNAVERIRLDLGAFA